MDKHIQYIKVQNHKDINKRDMSYEQNRVIKTVKMTQ